MLATLISATLAAASPCTLLPGADAVFAKSTTRVVWVGEMHGTAEQPAMFSDLVCAAARTGRPVVVALERQQSEQPLWDAYLASTGSEGDKAALLQGDAWKGTIQDGRSSQAMLALAEQLRQDRGRGLIVDVRLIISSTPGTGFDAQGHEARMAASVSQIVQAHPDALVLTYSGNAHARKGRNTQAQPAYTFAADLMPRESTITVNLIGGTGKAWNCQADGCGVHTYSGEDSGSRRIEISKSDTAYDLVGYTGVATTASPPAVMP